MERKQYHFALKSVDAVARTFSGHAAIFSVPDDGEPPDIMMPGAFAKTIAEWGPAGANRIKILALHHYDWLPIGRPLALAEDAAGLAFDGLISDTSLGADVLTLMQDAVITEMSIGYDAMRWEFDKTANVRRLYEVRLWEISPVTWAMHPQALITGVKALLQDARLHPEWLADPAIAEALQALVVPPAPAQATPEGEDPLSDPAVRQSLAQLQQTLAQ